MTLRASATEALSAMNMPASKVGQLIEEQSLN